MTDEKKTCGNCDFGDCQEYYNPPGGYCKWRPPFPEWYLELLSNLDPDLDPSIFAEDSARISAKDTGCPAWKWKVKP